MSTDWHIKCVDCGDEHRFNDANWRVDDMRGLIAHAATIAALAPALQDVSDLALELGPYGRVDAQWFARHLGHRLVPISEYGHLDEQCHAQVPCSDPTCWSRYPCILRDGHDGQHQRQCAIYHGNTRCSLVLGHDGVCR